MQELHARLSRVDAAGGEHGEAGQGVGYDRHSPQRDGSDGVPGHPAVGGQLLPPDPGPGRPVRLEPHQPGDGVGGRHAVRFT